MIEVEEWAGVGSFSDCTGQHSTTLCRYLAEVDFSYISIDLSTNVSSQRFPQVYAHPQQIQSNQPHAAYKIGIQFVNLGGNTL